MYHICVASSRISEVLTRCKNASCKNVHICTTHMRAPSGVTQCDFSFAIWPFCIILRFFPVLMAFHEFHLHFVIFLPSCLGPFAMYASSGAVKGRSWEVMLMPRSPMFNGPLTKAMTGIHTSWVAFGKKPGANMRLRFLQAFNYAREMCNQRRSQNLQRTQHWYTPVLVNENTCQGPCCLLFCSPAQWVGFCPAKTAYSRHEIRLCCLIWIFWSQIKQIPKQSKKAERNSIKSVLIEIYFHRNESGVK